jgi:hypothetical protein
LPSPSLGAAPETAAGRVVESSPLLQAKLQTQNAGEHIFNEFQLNSKINNNLNRLYLGEL